MDIQKILVMGAGTMGNGIAHVCAQYGFDVVLCDVSGEFLKRGYEPAGFMSAMDIGNRLVDPEWQGIDGKGHPDLALFVALPYYMEGLILSGLMHFALDLKTMTLDNMYHPHASWSFPNGTLEEWASNLKVMTSKFEGGQ